MEAKMTQREIDLLTKADEIIARNKTARTDYRFLHGAYEERAIIFAAEFWREHAGHMAEGIAERQREAMSMGAD